MSRLTAPRDSNRIPGLIVNDNTTNNEIIVGGNPTLQSINVSVVEGSISLSGADGAITDGASALIRATVFDLASSNPLATQIVDATGTAITSFGGGTQYTEGDTDATITGTAMLWEDTSDTLRPVSAAKPLPVDVKNTSLAVTGSFWQTTQPVSISTLPALTTGSAIIGRVGIDQTTPGTTNLVALTAETTKVIGTVNIAAAQTLATVTTVGAVTAITNALPAGTNNIGDVDVLTLPVAFNSGATSATTQRVITATDAGAAGRLAANSGVDIGDVDVTTIIPGVGATNLGKAEDVAHASGDTGVAMWGVRNSTLTAAVTSASGDYSQVSVDQVGRTIVVEKAPTSLTTSVGSSATTVTLLASNSDRVGATIYNDSTVALYVKLGAAASTTSFTIKMAADGYYEVPFGYTGVIDGIWVSATGNARIVEIT